MCKYCDGIMSLGNRKVRISANEELNVCGIIGLMKDGSDHHLYVRTKTSNRDQITLFDLSLKYCPFCGNKLLKDPIFPEITSDSAA